MNLIFKLSLPLVIGLSLTMGYLHFYWEPHQLEKGKSFFVQHNQDLLDSSESAIIRDILERNFAALIANVEYLQKDQQGVWFNMEIFSEDGTRLYPLFAENKVTDQEGHILLHQEHSLHLEESFIGKILVDVDWKQEKQRIQQDVATVRNMLLAMVIFSLLVIWMTQLRIVIHPLLRLRAAAGRIADGDLHILLPEASRDEVGELTFSFDRMAQELAFKQRALDQHANVSITDSRGSITYINENFIQTTGYSKDELLGQNHRILKSAEHGPAFYANLWQTIITGAVWHGEMCNRRKNGEFYWQETTIVPQMGKENRPERFIAISTDVTVRKRTEVELLQSRQQAESANQAKSRFLANMSHELRTPLNTIIGLTHMLSQRQSLAAEMREEVDKIHIAGQMLFSLVNDILDLSKIEAGEINLEMVPMKLEPLFNELSAMLTGQAKKKGLELFIAPLPDGADQYFIGDPTRLRQILINLLGNAIKFTMRGEISLVVQVIDITAVAGKETKQAILRFLVRDSGCGISAEVLPRLFDAFRQADSSITRTHGGTGLGLAIVKQLCEKMGGEVHVESILEKGSSFILDIPLQIATDAEIKQAGLFRKQLRILLAEDDPDQRRILLAMCGQLGWHVEAVSNGRELLQRYQEMIAEGEQIDCLIVDWMMPELDGLTAIFEIREKCGAEKMPGVLVVTEYSLDELEKSAHAKFPDLVLSKPMSVASLINGIGRVFSRYFNDIDLVLRSSTLDFAHLAWLPGVKILVVDDAQLNLDLATRLFTREGAVVFTCRNGAEALAWLHNADNHADIILMDIQMPVMDGNTAVRKIRMIERLRDIPVIALTAAALASERKISMEAGMNDYQTKPFDTEKMVRLIRRQVGLVRGVPVPVQEKREQQRETAADVSWPWIEGIESEGVRERINDDLDLFGDLLHRFVHETYDLRQTVPFPADQEKRDLLQARMHKLAGNAGLIGADHLSNLARRIEKNLREDAGQESAGIASLFAQVQKECERLQTAIAHYFVQNATSRQLTAQQGTARQEERGKAPTREQLEGLSEALKQKKILAAKLYREIQADLRSWMTEEAFAGLDGAMLKLDFAEAEKWLEPLLGISGQEGSTG